MFHFLNCNFPFINLKVKTHFTLLTSQNQLHNKQNRITRHLKCKGRERFPWKNLNIWVFLFMILKGNMFVWFGSYLVKKNSTLFTKGHTKRVLSAFEKRRYIVSFTRHTLTCTMQAICCHTLNTSNMLNECKHGW